MEANAPEDVTYVDDALGKLLDTLAELQALVRKRVISPSRAPLTLRIQQAVTQTEQVRELLNRANMGKRLGFVKEKTGIQPVMMTLPEPVNDAE